MSTLLKVFYLILILALLEQVFVALIDRSILGNASFFKQFAEETSKSGIQAESMNGKRACKPFWKLGYKYYVCVGYLYILPECEKVSFTLIYVRPLSYLNPFSADGVDRPMKVGANIFQFNEDGSICRDFRE